MTVPASSYVTGLEAAKCIAGSVQTVSTQPKLDFLVWYRSGQLVVQPGSMSGKTRSSGGAGAEGSYGPSDQLKQTNSSGNAADPSDPRPHITRSSGGAGVEGTYGPDSRVKDSKQSSKSCQQPTPQSAQNNLTTEQDRSQQQQQGTASSMDKTAGSDAGLAAEANLPDPMVAADDGSSNLHPRSKL